jgi:hypothetical protein
VRIRRYRMRVSQGPAVRIVSPFTGAVEGAGPMNARSWSRVIGRHTMQISREKGAHDQQFRSDLSLLLDKAWHGFRRRLGNGMVWGHGYWRFLLRHSAHAAEPNTAAHTARVRCAESRRRRAPFTHLSRLRRAAPERKGWQVNFAVLAVQAQGLTRPAATALCVVLSFRLRWCARSVRSIAGARYAVAPITSAGAVRRRSAL